MKENLYPYTEKANPANCISASMMKSNRIIGNIFRKYLKPFEITDSQFSILFVITKADQANQKKISDKLYMEKSTVNRNIKRLIERKYIALENDLCLKMTKKGRQFFESVLPEWEKAMKEINLILGSDGTEAISTISRKLMN